MILGAGLTFCLFPLGEKHHIVARWIKFGNTEGVTPLCGRECIDALATGREVSDEMVCKSCRRVYER